MIDAKELRIGNWFSGFVVAEAYSTGFVRVEKICPGSVYSIYQHYDVVCFSQLDPNHHCILKLENMTPINLHSELLQRLGFKKTVAAGIFFYDDFKLIFTEGIFYFNYGKYSQMELLYLHQLQNLFYALRGEELEIKESIFTVNEQKPNGKSKYNY